MKKMVAMFVAILVVMTGCTAANNERETTKPHETQQQVGEEQITLLKNETVQAERSRLSEKEKVMYDTYLDRMCRFEEFTVDFEEEGYGQESFERVVDAILEDYPQLHFFVTSFVEADDYDDDGYPINGYAGEVSYADNLTLGNFDPQKAKDIIEKIETAADLIIAEMPAYETNEGKYRWLGQKICEITEYTDFDDPTGRIYSAAGPLIDGQGLCQAYAMAYQWVCHNAGLWCVVVDGGTHTWNLVELEDGSRYHVDLTWGDQVDFEKYFLLTQEEIEKDHSPDQGEWQATK